MNNIPVFDLNSYNTKSKKILEALHEYGVLCIKVPKDSTAANNEFLDLMEKYSTLPVAVKQTHVRRNLHYQVGLTPEFIEKPRDRCDTVYALGAVKPKGFDPKSRWFHRLTPVELDTEYTDITGANVIPEQFPEWENTFNNIGDHFTSVLDALNTVVSIELGMTPGMLNDKCHNGNHMIAPTMSDLNTYNTPGCILAGFHSDISLFSIHGKSRFPGLNIWTRDGQKIRVKVPEDCFVVQAGSQLEYITGGYIHAGFHEVVVESDTLAIQRDSMTRVSSTFFAHINSDKYLEVLPQFATTETIKKYPTIKEGEWLRRRLKKLMH